MDISVPDKSQTKRLSIRYNTATGKLEGVPDKVREAILNAGFTEEQVMKDPSLIVDLVYELDLSSIFEESASDIIYISKPQPFQTKRIAITFNHETGKFEGVPEKIRKAISDAGYTEEEVMKDPSLVKDILYQFNADDVLGDIISNISGPTQVKHHISISFNEKTGKFEGIPDAVRKAISDAGFTEEEVMKDPSIAKDVLYKLSLADVLKDAIVHHISAPIRTSHNVSITFNAATGKFEGVPEGVRQAILNAGFTEEEVVRDPSLIKDILYKLSEADVLGTNDDDAGSFIEVSSPISTSHNIHITFNAETGRFEGIPPAVRKALEDRGLTEEEVMRDIFSGDPQLDLKEILYELTLEDIVRDGISNK